MNKKIMLLALAAISAAMFALPALASATPSHISSAENFTISGGAGKLTRHSNDATIECTSVGGSGSFDAGSTTTGKITLEFKGCHQGIIPCQNGASGVIVAGPLPFHMIMVETNKAGILITGSGAGVTNQAFSAFTCFGVPVNVFGTGIIGTIETACGVSSKEHGVTFQSNAPGTQKHTTWTGASYDLQSRIGASGAHETSAIDTTAVIKFANAKSINCTA